MKTATLFCLINLLTLVAQAAAPINFKNITSTNVVKTNDLLLIDSDLGGGIYATRTIPIALLPSGGDTIWTTNASGALIPSTSVPSSNLFSIHANGAISGGNTNRWILGGATNGAPDVNVDGVHYPLAVTDSPALTGTPTINGQSVETQLTNKVAKAGDTMTGNLSSPNFIIPPTSLASSDLTNIVVDFTLAGLRTCILSTNTIISAKSFSAGVSAAIRLTNSSASIITLTFTNTWPTPLGSAAPSQMLPGKVGVLAVTSWGTTEPEFTWTYAVQP